MGPQCPRFGPVVLGSRPVARPQHRVDCFRQVGRRRTRKVAPGYRRLWPLYFFGRVKTGFSRARAPVHEHVRVVLGALDEHATARRAKRDDRPAWSFYGAFPFSKTFRTQRPPREKESPRCENELRLQTSRHPTPRAESHPHRAGGPPAAAAAGATPTRGGRWAWRSWGAPGTRRSCCSLRAPRTAHRSGASRAGTGRF